MSLELVPLSARPDCVPLLFGPALRSLWPEFMMHDTVADLYFDTPQFDRYQDFAFAIIDPARPEAPVGRSFSVPFHFGGDRAELPDSGWDGVIRWAHQDAMQGRPPNALSALEITLLPSHRGQGQSAVVLEAMRRHATAHWLGRMFAPVRPTAKSREPFLPMAEYLARRTADGFSVDPWVRTHERIGGRIVKIAPTSMVIPGTLAEWRSWTGLPLTESGPVAIEGGLTPLHVSVEQDHAVYVEPNVWIEHPLKGPAA
jgi:GNAT superfamily N-acetyltransferase